MNRPALITLVVLLLQGLIALPARPHTQAPAPRSAMVAAELKLTGGKFEPSGAAFVPAASGVLFVDDDRTREVMWLPFAAGQAGTPRAIRMPTNVVDPEGMTFDGRYHYLVGSQSKRTGSRGDGLVRFVFNPTTLQVDQVTSIQGLRAFLGRHVAQLAGVERQTDDRSLNIESIAWDPERQRWLLGLRAPLVNGKALVVPLELADREAGFTAGNLRVPGGRAYELALDSAGIRSLEYDETRKTFQIVTGAAFTEERLIFQLSAWPGPDSGRVPTLERTFPRGTKPEGIARIWLDGTTRTIVVYDGSGYLLLD